MSNNQATKLIAKKATRVLRAVLYARVSSDDRGKDGRNLKSQLDMCREYALEQGYIIVAELAEDDRGASGASFELPQLSNVLAMAERGEYDVLVIRELDRLSRNLAKQLIVEEELRRNSVQVEYVLAEYDDTPEGQLQKLVRASVAEYERLKINERMTRGRRNKVKGGKIIIHNAPPYGYCLSDDYKLVIHEPEARIVRLIFSWYTEGDETGKLLSMQAIADKLTEMKVPTWVDARKQTKFKKVRGCGEWSAGSVWRILHKETYIGKWQYGKGAVEVDVPSIIDERSWLAVQRQTGENGGFAERNTKYEYLMRSRLVCECGYTTQCLVTPYKEKYYLYYRCPTMINNKMVGDKCGAPHFRADHVDDLVWYWLKCWLQDPDNLEDKLRVYKAGRDKANAPVLALLETNEALLQDYKSKRDRLLDLYLSGEFDRDILAARKMQLEETIAKLDQERGRLVSQIEQDILGDREMNEIVAFASKLAEGLNEADASFEARQRIIELLDVRGMLMVKSDGRKVVCPWFVLSGPDENIELDLSVASLRSCLT